MRYLTVSTHLDADSVVSVDAYPASSSGRPFVSLEIEGNHGRIVLMVSAGDGDALRTLARVAIDAAQALDAIANDVVGVAR
ncbi:hypothetical protein H9Y04_30595 [Streptomyces sp. TRM66268-LWL]|uniref:Uncharacterized protein n=1 Tax=Streptomyces polyasparticus TaxID=2767826 RepID=A0ABR7SQD4_9ACTN|nr:hypothetical protein [Streptomyces polyasparticus]MBC9716890.1 hypothetical protein [Streptomyces polyasparticus]